MSRSPFSEKTGRVLDEIFVRDLGAPAGAGLLVALSGGPDSVAMLLTAADWCKKTGRPLEAAHVNHRLRGNEADADAHFCAGLCAAHGILLHQHAEDPRPIARTRGQGLEEAGRHLRRRYFRSLLDARPALACVATGHHRDDQIETVVMRLFRGTGPDGLRGLRTVQGRTIHPLLTFGRGEILGFLAQRNQPWRIDATNESDGNVRARVRRELLPLAREIFGPGCGEACARLAELMDDEAGLLDGITAPALNGATAGEAEGETAGPAALDVPALVDMEPALARRVLRRWLETVRPGGAIDVEKVHLENILGWLREGTSGSRLDVPGGSHLRRDFDRLSWSNEECGPPLRSAADYRILVTGAGPIGDAAVFARDEEAAACAGPPWNLTCPASVLQGSVRIRNWREGDRFQPFGLDGTRKLSDLLRERKVPSNERAGTLVVEDDGGILWVVGLARAERTRLLPSSGAAVTIGVIARTTEPTSDQTAKPRS